MSVSAETASNFDEILNKLAREKVERGIRKRRVASHLRLGYLAWGSNSSYTTKDRVVK